jgi:cell division protein FtsL
MMVCACVCGGALVYVSQRVQQAQEDIEQVAHDLAQEKDSIRVLQAEWAYLNAPQRLEKLVQEHLNLSAPSLVSMHRAMPDLENPMPAEQVTQPVSLGQENTGQ